MRRDKKGLEVLSDGILTEECTIRPGAYVKLLSLPFCTCDISQCIDFILLNQKTPKPILAALVLYLNC